MNLLDLFTNSTPAMPDDRHPFINDEEYSVLMLINPVILTCAISVVGIAANIANIIIFIKLGFKETINISLVALAVYDLASLLCLVWMSLSFSSFFCDLLCDVMDVEFFEDTIIGCLRTHLTTVSGCITCLIAFERCLCVMRPLKVKQIMTKKRLQIILPSIFIGCLIPFCPMMYTITMLLLASEGQNTTAVDEEFGVYEYHDIDLITNGMVSTLCLSTYVGVTVLTALIVWKLTTQSQWRARQLTADTSQAPDAPGNSSSGKQAGKKGLSEKDRRATMAVTVIATMYIISYFPGTVIYLAMTISIDFNSGMLYANLYNFMWYLAYAAESVSAGANIIVYLKTSKRFKEAFCNSFCCFHKNKS